MSSRREHTEEEPADAIHNPVTGDTIVFHRRAADTNGELLEGEVIAAPYTPGLPEHVHPNQDEYFEVLEGSIAFKVGGEVRHLSEGEDIHLPRGVPHMWWNETGEEARTRFEARPALRLETVLETFFGLARDGKTDDRGLPNVLQTAVIMNEFRDVAYLADPSLFTQKLLFGPLAPIGKLRGYEPYYPKHSSTEEASGR